MGAGHQVGERGAAPALVELAVEARGGELGGLAGSARPGERQAELRALDGDAAGRVGREPLEPLPGVGVRRHVAAAGRDRPVGGALEQQAAERRVAAAEGRRPPQDRLMTRARERDVGDAQVLAALLDHELLAVTGEVGAAHADVDRPHLGLVVERDRHVLRDVARLEQVRVVDDAELQPLAAVHGEDLDGVGVRLQAAAAVLVAGVPARLGDPPPQPAGERGGPELLGVQQLADVPQVGQPALAAHAGEHARGQALGERDRLHQRRDPAQPQHPRPVVQAAVDVLPFRVARRRDPLGAPAQERGQRGGAGAQVRRRPLQRLEQPQPLLGLDGAEHAARAVDDGGDAGGVERVADPRGVAVGLHEHGHVGGLGLAAGEQPDEVGGDVLGDVLADRGQLGVAARRGPHVAAPRRRGSAAAGRACPDPRAPRAPCGRRSPRARAAHRRTARRRRRSAPGRCGG